MRWRESDDVVGGFVVLEIVVIVLHEEDWRRTEIGAVERSDLRAGGALEHGLIVAAEHRCAVEPAGDRLGFGRSAIKLRCQRDRRSQ